MANRKPVQVPAELHARLVREAELWDEQWARSPHTTKEPPVNKGGDGIPLWAVIEKALDELESHRLRSKKRAGKKDESDGHSENVH